MTEDLQILVSRDHVVDIDQLLTWAGSILFDGLAIVITLGLLFLANRKRAAVGRRYVL